MHSQKGFAHLVLLLLLIAGIGIGTYLVQTKTNLLPQAFQADPCAATVVNLIACENSKPGSPKSEWDVTVDNGTIAGFPTNISYNKGETAQFKVKTDSSNYRIDIYRLGFYQGKGARKMASVEPSISLPQTQPKCLFDPVGKMTDCGNWNISASWQIPADAVSGAYWAKLIREDSKSDFDGFLFIVRDDSSRSDIVYQTSDTTAQAYNNYTDQGVGYSLYLPNSNYDRGYKVSYNRPDGANSRVILQWEFPLISFLESNGFDVSYISGIDTDRSGSLLLNHKLFISAGHDEYWSGNQRANVEAARDKGVNLAFFSANEVFWKTRLESSFDVSKTPNRTLVTYKESYNGQKIDPLPNVWTGTWRDPRQSPPADGGRPENALTGTLYVVNSDRKDPIEVPFEESKMRFWRNTSVAGLATDQKATFANGTLGYEWDIDADNGFRPAGLMHLSSTTVTTDNEQLLLDHGTTYGKGTVTHNMTLYKAQSGALIFGSGTVQLPWVLMPITDSPYPALSPDKRMQQAIINLFADMKIQPSTILSGLSVAQASTDNTAPTSNITSPTNGVSLILGNEVTISGRASDANGKVAAIEVSVDGGNRWHPAVGRENWQYKWTPLASGQAVIKVRSSDDSGNLSTSSNSNQVNVIPGSNPCSWVKVESTLPSPRYAGDKYEFSAKSNCDNGAQYTWWIRPQGQDWTRVTEWSTSNIFNWNTANLAPGNYDILVWAENTSKNIMYRSATPFPYKLDPKPCDYVTTNASQTSPQPVGGTYQFSASSLGCPAGVEYQWWFRQEPKYPGDEQLWDIAQPFNTSKTLNWNTTGKLAGTYDITVWTRTPQGAVYMGAPGLKLTLSNAPASCNTASIQALQTSPQIAGGTYQFSATSNCGDGAQYVWWVRSEGEDWIRITEWDSSNQFNWNTVGKILGKYDILVWVRNASGNTMLTTVTPIPYVIQ